MFLVQVTYTMRPGQREGFLQEVRTRGILEKIRREPGCLGYAYYLPEEEDGTLLLVEKWSDDQAQKEHLATPHMAELAQLKPQYVAATAVISWEAQDK